jgi:hypothetical protein
MSDVLPGLSKDVFAVNIVKARVGVPRGGNGFGALDGIGAQCLIGKVGQGVFFVHPVARFVRHTQAAGVDRVSIEDDSAIAAHDSHISLKSQV